MRPENSERFKFLNKLGLNVDDYFQVFISKLPDPGLMCVDDTLSNAVSPILKC